MPLKVEKISEGTVIDHIKAGAGTRVLSILSNAYPLNKMAALIINAPSKKFGRKDIVKIEGKMVSQEMANLIALVSPGATVNIVKGGEVEKKYDVVLPKEVKEYGKCPNPN